MKALTSIYRSKYGKDPDNPFRSKQSHNSTVDHPMVSVQRPSDEDILKRDASVTVPSSLRQNYDENWPERRKVSASIRVPQPLRTPQDPSAMSDLMAAMVLSNLSSSPVLYNYIKETSPRSYDSSGVESWGQDSQRTSPFHRPLSSNFSSERGLKQEFDDNSSDFSNSDCGKSRSRTLDEVSEMDPGTILLQSPASTPQKQTNADCSDEFDDDKPQDFTMKTLVAKEKAQKQKKFEKREKEKSEEEAKLLYNPSPANLAVPPSYPLFPHPFSLPYYFQSSFLNHPFPSSLPNDLLAHLNASSPASLRSVDNPLGLPAPGQFSGKFHPYSRRSAPYHKFSDDSAFSSPLRCVSPSKFALGSAPASFYRLPTSSPLSGSELSFSPSRVRKRSKSPLTLKYPVRLSLSNPTHNGPIIPLPADGSGLGLSRETQRPHFEHVLPHQVGSWKRDFNFAQQFSNQRQMGQKQQQILFSPNTSRSLPKSLPLTIGRKVPGDGKKCRKVYGMDNKDLWCTACRWKKACQRFPD